MINRSNIFKVLGIILALLSTTLIAINTLYIKASCPTSQCTVINISTTLLLIWAIAFLFVVLKYSRKDNDKKR